jgi:tetratricopeptide (TPR) repeat protein
LPQYAFMRLTKFIWIFGLSAVCLLASKSWAANVMTRQQAVNALTSQSAKTKLDAITRLAKIGQMQDSEALVAALKDSDPAVSTTASSALWQIWARANDKAVDQLYRKGLQAITTFSKIISIKPQFAEAWNKRATVYYFVGDLQKSIADCDEVMKRNPNHFGALSGYGQIFAQMGDLDQALRYFEKAYAINPTMLGVAQAIQDIRKLQEREGARRT